MAHFLVSTDHLREGVWFRDDEDYHVGMNYVAIVAFSLGIPVLAFVLMSNHVHLILECSEEQALAFITEYKRLYSFYYRHKYKVKEFLRNNGSDFRYIAEKDESLERAIAYVQMNPVAANICLSSSQYPWGTGSSFFNKQIRDGVPLSDFSHRRQIQLLHSNIKLPQNYHLADGYILPESFVKTQCVETLYRTPKRMNYFLVNTSKAKWRIENQDSRLPSFRDQSLCTVMTDLSRSLFNRNSIECLDPPQQAEVIRQLRYRFSADVVQISRVSGIPYETLCKYIDTF